MGCNYYLRYNICDKCGRHDEIHLGKASPGWKFLLQYNNGQYYTTWEEMKGWLLRMTLLGAEIVDEYNRRTTLKKFIRLVESKQSEKSRPH